jgi:hypothetical protein
MRIQTITTPDVSQPDLAQIETGGRLGDVALYCRLARHLGIRIEDLLSQDR